MKKKYILEKSDNKQKKYKISNGKTINFGAKGYTDFTINKNPKKKSQYIARHKVRENWTKSGIDTAGFWAKHILWSKPSLSESIKSAEKRFNINIINRINK